MLVIGGLECILHQRFVLSWYFKSLQCCQVQPFEPFGKSLGPLSKLPQRFKGPAVLSFFAYQAFGSVLEITWTMNPAYKNFLVDASEIIFAERWLSNTYLINKDANGPPNQQTYRDRCWKSLLTPCTQAFQRLCKLDPHPLLSWQS